MTAADDLAGTVRRISEMLRRFSIGFHVTGGVACSYHGEPRFTQDIDIVIDPAAARARLEDLLRAMDGVFLVDPSLARAAVARGGVFQALDLASFFKVDIYPRELIPGELGRAEPCELFPGVVVALVSHVDAILSKLIWVQKGSHRSRRDVRTLQASLDERHTHELTDRAKAMHLERLLGEVLSESEPDE
jgi:hypothetical protein